MSMDLGLAVLHEDYDDPRIPVMEHYGAMSREAVVALTGRDPIAEGPEALGDIYRQLGRIVETDLRWGGGMPDAQTEVFDWSDGQTVKRNRKGQTVVQWGVFGTTHAEDGRHYHHIPKPGSVAEALAFDPAPYFPESVEQLTARFTSDYERMVASCEDVCFPMPHHYTTAFHFPLAIFGFELLCEAGMEDDAAFGKLMERFAAISQKITTAWANVPDLKGFILHDDLTMTSGPVFPPAWYRRHIFPHYPEVFRPLLEKDIPILFTSDGDCTAFVDDIFAAGADGLNFEHWVDLEMLVDKYPDKMLVGNLNSEIIARGTPEQIIRHTEQTILTGARGRRFVINVGGQLTHDIPVENIRLYLETRQRLARTARLGQAASI